MTTHNTALTVTPEFIVADIDVRPLNDASLSIVSQVMAQYEAEPKALLHETLKGHVVTIRRSRNHYITGSEDRAGRMTAKDAQFFLSLGKGLRWFEFRTDSILLGIDNEPLHACAA